MYSSPDYTANMGHCFCCHYISSFEHILGVKTILMGLGLEQNAIHSPNESMDLEVWEKGIIAVTEFYQQYQNA